jgi:alcohol dehydrogenase class IV
VAGPLKPLMAIPTTAGTGSENDWRQHLRPEENASKTGITNRRLKPTLGYLDPDNTRTLPPQVAASTGLDILSHAIESFTALPFTERPLPDRPALRPAYQGSNPIGRCRRCGPARHLQAAEALGVDVSGARAEDAGKILADRLTWFMQRLNAPNGLRAIGYTSSDIPALVEGTLPQHRVTKLSPRAAGPDELAALFEDAMVGW